MLGSWIVVWGSVSCVGTDRWNKKRESGFSVKLKILIPFFTIRSDGGVNVDFYQVHPELVWINAARWVRMVSIFCRVSGLVYGMRLMIRFR